MKTRTNRSVLTLVTAAFLSGVCAEGQEAYTTTFTSGTNFVPAFQAGSFSATFAGPALTYFAQGPAAEDPCIRNIGAGRLTLTFSQPVTSVSFDVGGLDGFNGDGVTFDMVPLLGTTINRNYYMSANAVALLGTTLICPGNYYGNAGARVSFTDLGGGAGVTSLGWSDVGTGGLSDWVLYDNFAFTVIPEPAVLSVAALGGLIWGVFHRRKQL